MKQLTKISLRYMSKPFCFLFFLIFNFSSILAQQDNLFEKFKIDGVAAVVGDFIILDSDIDKTLIDLQSQGVSVEDFTRCSLLGKLMEDKLYAHHAEQDSLEIDSQQIYSYVDQTIDYFVNQLGNMEKVLDFYKKKDEQTFRQELYEINRINQLSERMQTTIIDEIEITPEEVKSFFEIFPGMIYQYLELNLKYLKLLLNQKLVKKIRIKLFKDLSL